MFCAITVISLQLRERMQVIISFGQNINKMWTGLWTATGLLLCHRDFDAFSREDLKTNQFKSFPSFTVIYTLTAWVAWAPQMTSQPVSSVFPCFPLPSRTWRTPGLSISWWCRPTSSSVCLVFFPLSLCLARWFLARLDERETWPYHCSLRLFTVIRRSSCGPIACWILAQTS